MSMTGPGCPACDYSGCTTLDGEPAASAFNAIPCGACSPWSYPPDFPDAALRTFAAGVLRYGHDDPRMVEWALRLDAYAAEVDAERAHAKATTCADAPLRCGR